MPSVGLFGINDAHAMVDRMPRSERLQLAHLSLQGTVGSAASTLSTRLRATRARSRLVQISSSAMVRALAVFRERGEPSASAAAAASWPDAPDAFLQHNLRVLILSSIH